MNEPITIKTKITKRSDNTYLVELEGSGFIGIYCATSLGVTFEKAYEQLTLKVAEAILKE